jgi:hypothetical protein
MDVLTSFESRLDYLNALYVRRLRKLPQTSATDLISFGESMISLLWQAWHEFSRTAIIESCLGSTTTSGLTTTATRDWVSDGRLNYLARCAVNRSAPRVGQQLSFRYQEITWGDVDKAYTVVAALMPTNSRSLLSAFGASALSPRHLRIVRNACAHWQVQSVAEVRALSAYYSGRSVRHPSHVAWTTRVGTTTESFLFWTDELRALAGLAVA